LASSEGSNFSSLLMSAALGAVPRVARERDSSELVRFELAAFELLAFELVAFELALELEALVRGFREPALREPEDLELPPDLLSAIPLATIPADPSLTRQFSSGGLNWLKSDQDYLVREPRARQAMADYANDILVETDWVEEHLEDDDIRIVEVDENPALYAEAHIPGAIGFDWKKDLQDQVKRDFLGPEEFGKLMGSRGISNDHTVVLYGDRNNWFAAYTYWFFRYYGHDKVKLINGPREKWLAEDRPTSTDVPSYPEVSFEAKGGDDSIRAKRDEVLAALDSSTSLVDVRSPQEYSGELIAMAGYEQEGAQRSGHIPGAASIPWAQAVQEDGTFKSADELRELYEGKGVIENGNPIIAYCRIGERSAHTWFVLHELLGEGNVKNYDGSWTEWGNLVDVPIEKDV
jgi:thiosulfate/3-mercaptopyruvate sulfurtransferase